MSMRGITIAALQAYRDTLRQLAQTAHNELDGDGVAYFERRLAEVEGVLDGRLDP